MYLIPAINRKTSCLVTFLATLSVLVLQVKIQSSPMYQTLARLGKGGYGYVYSGVRVQANRKSYQDKPMNVSHAAVFFRSSCVHLHPA